MEILILINLLLILLILGYPVFAYLRTSGKKNNPQKGYSNFQPISIIITVFNEEEYIEKRIEQLLSTEDWIEGSEIIILSAASTDGTNQILSKYKENQIFQILFSKESLSKIQAVNHCVSLAHNDILLFSDCRQTIKPGSVIELISNFKDPDIGTVCSTLIDRPGKASFFRRIFNSIAIRECGKDSCLNVYGALYAQRKSVFRKIPEQLLFDDLFVVVSTLVQGKRLIQEPRAIIQDVEFKHYYRKERIERLVRGLLLFFTLEFNLIRKLNGFTFYRFFMYKYAKLFLPFLITILCILIIFQYYHIFNVYWFLSIAILAALVLLINPIRKFVFLNSRIHYYFLIATLGFLFGSNNSNRWSKLKTT